ncbi:MAG: 16S rRNA (cytosine(1402)-N(4))-methyltransferase RsmH [Synergistaceae bacterium]|nr:16S rRNA (cytosine(1402)-N(4))-methyltransferase RsmH [Synergistaceae bacterium]MBQ9629807.1 16S rRNA (cytosine(1402)-N(4))-methyltransferase RsmH [Synergistaceae bacterium]
MMHHEPVMLNETLELIRSHSSHKKILDGTLGLGGYSEAILNEFDDAFVLGIDCDEDAIRFSRERLKKYEDDSRFKAIHSNFGSIAEIEECRNFDAYVFDLGVSNMQLELPERGFSFNNDGPLDMRMNQSEDNMTASEILECTDEKTLAKIFFDYGEERHARRIANAIKHSRTKINTTADLVKLIRETLPQPLQRKMGTHPARRIFQALRIYINDETGELERLLDSFPKIAAHDVIIIFVAYHSLEDRIIKRKFREWQNDLLGKIITKHPLVPSEEEIARNYKARSAKLRAFCLSAH